MCVEGLEEAGRDGGMGISSVPPLPLWAGGQWVWPREELTMLYREIVGVCGAEI